MMWRQASTATWDGKARGYDLGDKEACTVRLVGEGGCMSAEQSGGLNASGDGHHLSPDEDGRRGRLREARALAKSDPGEGLPLVASLCHELAWDLLDKGLLSDAEALVREELVAVRFLATYDPETFLPNVADACENLAGILWEGGHPEEAEPLLREALSLRRALAGQDPTEDLLSEVASSCVNLAFFLEDLGRFKEAEPLLREALECYRTLAASDPDEDGLPALIPEAGPPMGVLATILAEEGRAKEAEELFREGLSMYAILAQAHPEREDFRLGEEAFRESLAQLSAGV